jgi:GAF domain
LLQLAGSWPAALELIAGLARTLTGAPAAVRLEGRRRVRSRADQGPSVRSTVAAPIYESDRIVGHLEVSSNQFEAFDEADLRAVSMLAAVLSEMRRLRSAPRPDPLPALPPKPWLAVRIAHRMEGMLPTVRLRLVL